MGSKSSGKFIRKEVKKMSLKELEKMMEKVILLKNLRDPEVDCKCDRDCGDCGCHDCSSQGCRNDIVN